MENEIEIVIHVDSSDSGTDKEDELETYDEDTEDDELMFMVNVTTKTRRMTIALVTRRRPTRGLFPQV